MAASVREPGVRRPVISRLEGRSPGSGPFRYSIATLVNDLEQYDALQKSLALGGSISESQ